MPAVSQAQQKLFGIAYAVKQGHMKLDDVAPEYRDKVKDLVGGMTADQLKDYAETAREGLPQHAEEGLSYAASYNAPQGASMPGSGMGKIALPDMSTGATGSGDVPAGQGDAEEEFKKAKRKRKRLLQMQKIQSYESFINEKYGTK